MINTIDLLDRPEIQLNETLVFPFIKNKVILITGAAGSIGSEIVKQLSAFEPKEIILFGHNESGMFFLEKELKEKYPNIKYNIQLGSVCDYDRLFQVCDDYHVDIFYHAAANKHVPISEDNAYEAFKTNVGGTLNALDACVSTGVKNFVLISTDKAVNPTSVMGMTKRLAEILTICYSKKECCFNIVRFGNVLGSSGSVVPIFEEQIKNNKDLTITHPDMERFFMTIPEASRLVIQASSFNENNKLYILKMGSLVKILDIANKMIDILGKKNQIKIIFSGIRPGEKISEELSYNQEELNKTQHDLIVSTNSSHANKNYVKIIKDLLNNPGSSLINESNSEIKIILKDLLK